MAELLDYRCGSLRVEFLHLVVLHPESWPVHVVIQGAHTSLCVFVSRPVVSNSL